MKTDAQKYSPLAFKHSSTYATAKELYQEDAWLSDEERVVASVLLDAFDSVRERLKQPLYITSGRRSEQKQRGLVKLGFKAAKRSTHTLGLAIDVIVPYRMKDYAFAALFSRALTDSCQGVQPRCGYIKYRGVAGSQSHFIHVDIAPYAALCDQKAALRWPKEWLMAGLVF